ncbi:thiamine phosphate synthase [Fredinandcohnia quinoae]|uniref:Thiamine-phosphate synthase n=1 Tax=Fredinandcohnia quinoae TaxID=2918902 RepID=A0AAW5E3C7_9BACI|nr:thiamine phosphate synthase [Fredinandcohnia sp. SECRCQ15]MCH1627008.1 thiamine phosphate synthase [Fredinandcohnia sp. SECRCQ15]
MKLDNDSMLLYAVTDRAWLGDRTLAEQVEDAIIGGVTFVQLREKSLPYDEFLKQAIHIKKITDTFKVPFVINDNVEVAIASDADGVHVGQEDLSVKKVRSMIGSDKILGVSVQTVEQALKAEQEGANYLGIGDVFGTKTKHDATPMNFETVKEICTNVSIPVVAIGGINETNLLELSGSGVDGVAVISAIFANSDIVEACQKLLELSKKMVNEGSV